MIWRCTLLYQGKFKFRANYIVARRVVNDTCSKETKINTFDFHTYQNNTLRAASKYSKLLRLHTVILEEPTAGLSNITMASEKSTANQTKEPATIVINSIKPLNQGESRYVKPMRMNFTLNGKTRDWDCLKVHDSVACVIYNKTRNKLIYVKQFRPAVFLSSVTSNISNFDRFDPSKIDIKGDSKLGYTMELCAGLADKDGKTPQEVMQEEIDEETGYKVPLESIKFISSFRGSTGTSGTIMNLYFCEVTDEQRLAKGGGIDDEAIEVMELDIEDARKAIYCKDEDAPYSRPPAALFGTCWFLYEYLPRIK